jgi:hypothetical protein
VELKIRRMILCWQAFLDLQDPLSGKDYMDRLVHLLLVKGCLMYALFFLKLEKSFGL